MSTQLTTEMANDNSTERLGDSHEGPSILGSDIIASTGNPKRTYAVAAMAATSTPPAGIPSAELQELKEKALHIPAILLWGDMVSDAESEAEVRTILDRRGLLRIAREARTLILPCNFAMAMPRQARIIKNVAKFVGYTLKCEGSAIDESGVYDKRLFSLDCGVATSAFQDLLRDPEKAKVHEAALSINDYFESFLKLPDMEESPTAGGFHAMRLLAMACYPKRDRAEMVRSLLKRRAREILAADFQRLVGLQSGTILALADELMTSLYELLLEKIPEVPRLEGLKTFAWHYLTAKGSQMMFDRYRTANIKKAVPKLDASGKPMKRSGKIVTEDRVTRVITPPQVKTGGPIAAVTTPEEHQQLLELNASVGRALAVLPGRIEAHADPRVRLRCAEYALTALYALIDPVNRETGNRVKFVKAEAHASALKISAEKKVPLGTVFTKQFFNSCAAARVVEMAALLGGIQKLVPALADPTCASIIKYIDAYVSRHLNDVVPNVIPDSGVGENPDSELVDDIES